MGIFEDVVAEQDRLESILSGLSPEAWLTESSAAGWTIADVVLHLTQTDEAVVTSAATVGSESTSGTAFGRTLDAGTVDTAMDDLVRAERTTPVTIFERWQNARRASVDALRQADPDRPLPWVATSLKPTTLATTRLAEYWAHGIDITAPLRVPFPDTARLRHVAWLGHSTLAYAFALAGERMPAVFCELTGPDGEVWRYGSPSAESTISGPAGAFCRVGAHRLAPSESGLVTTGPHGATALRLLRNYAL